MVKKNYDNLLSRFHLIPERHGQTGGQTDRFAISILRVSVLTRDKSNNFLKFLFQFFQYFQHLRQFCLV